MQIKEAIGSFFVEFTKFETNCMGMALRSLSRDPVFVTHAEQLLDFEARLKLLERMAFAREVPAGLVAELETCLLRARHLRDQRDEVARNLMTDADGVHSLPAGIGKPRARWRRNADFSRLAELENLWVPAVERVQEYTTEALELQETLRLITQKLEGELPAAAGAR